MTSDHIIPDHIRPDHICPGEILFAPGEIELNAGYPLLTVEVANNGDQPVELGSHYHVAEANPALEFNREAARGYRLAIPAGTTLRLEPGQRRMLDLVPYGGTRELFGFRGELMGPIDAAPSPDKPSPDRSESTQADPAGTPADTPAGT